MSGQRRAWPGSTKKRSLLDRFLEKVSPEPNTGCWLWTGATVPSGYGYIVQGKKRFDATHAHRAAYSLFRGDIGGLCVLHRCDNRVCVNPDHLFLGTKKDNAQDKILKGRAYFPRARRNTLTQEQIDDIRTKRLKGVQYAAMYGVSASVVSRIQTRAAVDPKNAVVRITRIT